MAISRRGVLLRGSAIGVGIIAANVPGLVAFAQPLPPLRRSLHGLALNDPILQAWRDGVRLLKARPASDPVSWANFAAIHGGDAGFNLCPHGNWYFLPWHRAYLLMYERTVRQLTGFSDFALPWTGPWIGRCRRLSSIRLSLEILIRYSRPSAMPRRWIRCRQHRGAGDHQSDSP